jgi:predicted Zn-dependent protease
MNHFRLINALILIASAVTLGCQTSPLGRKQLMLVPAGQMDSMGIQAFQDMKTTTKIEKDPATNAYVKCVANGITSAMSESRDWEVVVFKDDTANAFALPGGKIGVHTGLLKVATSADQLAAVIGHEVGHVIAQHGNERVSEQIAEQGGLALVSAFTQENKNSGLMMAALGIGTQFGVALPHSRTQESEADLIGLDLMAKAGFNPEEAVALWHNMEKAGGGAPPEWLSTHPSDDRRIASLQDHMGDALKEYRAARSHPVCKR